MGWILVLGEWLNMAGPLGSILAFAFGAVVMIFVGLCYAEMASMLPVCGGEVVYNYEVFGLKTSFTIGWALAFAWIVVTAFEVIAVGWILGTIFPSLKGETLYTVNG
ncbi:MAG: amino acid permease, partial [Petrotogales bacterium]